jgi:hypothetical protein
MWGKAGDNLPRASLPAASERLEGVPPLVQPPPEGHLVYLDPLTKAFAYVLAVVSFGGAVVFPLLIVFSLITPEWPGLVKFGESLLLAAAAACACVTMGRLMWRAVRTGVDPPSEDRAIAAAETRAMLQALERHDLLLGETWTVAGARPGGESSDPTSDTEGIKDERFYEPTDRGYEAKIAARMKERGDPG